MNNQIPDYVKRGRRAPTSNAWKKSNVPVPVKPTDVIPEERSDLLRV